MSVFCNRLKILSCLLLLFRNVRSSAALERRLGRVTVLRKSQEIKISLPISVWLEVMLPVMTMKHYSKFVVNYLVQLLKMHKVTEATMMNKPVVDLQNFLTIQDSVFIVANQINKEYARYIFVG